MCTVAEFVIAVADAGASTAGIVRSFAYEPVLLNSADLPASFVRLPGGRLLEGYAAACRASWKMRAVELVVALVPAGQGTPTGNHAAAVRMMDALEAALDVLAVTDFLEYSLQAGGVSVGDVVYWAVVAAVQGRS